MPASKLQIVLLVEIFEAVDVLIALIFGIRRPRFREQHRADQVGGQQRVADRRLRDEDVAHDESLAYRQRQDALRIDIHIGDVSGDLPAVADFVIVRIDLEDVLLVGLEVEDLTNGRVHERQERVGRHVRVAGEVDERDDRVLDDAERDRDAVRALFDHRRGLIRKETEVVDRPQVFLHDGRVEGVADFGPYDGQDALGGDMRIARDRDRDDRRCLGLRYRGRHRQAQENQRRKHDALRATRPIEQAVSSLYLTVRRV